VIGYASAHGMKVILDMHNYARRKENGTTYLIGTGPVSLSSFADAWRRIADHYKGNSTIHAYGIMNEPHSTGGTWPDMAQAAVNAIRTVDLTHYVLVGGDTWSNAVGWRSKNPNLDTQDPVGRLIYEAHCYFDNDNSGTYNQSYDGEGAYPEVGVDRVREFVEWLEERGARGFIGEYGVPGNDPRWLTVLDNFLAYIQAHGLSGTYWAGGPWWGSYALSCEPTNNFTADRPQMSVLEDYTGEP
jgi:endoglucanase